MNDTTQTPRTEEVVINFDHWSELVDFARQLERELTTSRELCEQYKEIAKKCLDCLIPIFRGEHEILEAQLEALTKKTL